MSNRIRIIILSFLFIITIFVVSFSIGSYAFFKDKNFSERVEEAKTSFANEKKNLDLETSIAFKIKVVSTGETVRGKTVKLKDIISEFDKTEITIEDLKQKYSATGYNYEGSFENTITFIKVNKFRPGKFYLGERNGFVAIYKCNEEGELIIENIAEDVLSTKIINIPENDRKLIETNMFEFSTKKEAKDEVLGLIS